MLHPFLCLFQCHPRLFPGCQRLLVAFKPPQTTSEVRPRLWSSVWKFFQPSRQDTPTEGIHFMRFYLFILPTPSSFPPLKSQESPQRTWASPGSDLLWIPSDETGEKYFSASTDWVQDVTEKRGVCSWAGETIQAAEVNLRYWWVFATLRGTMLATGTKRFLLCGLPMCEGGRQQARLRATGIQTEDILNCKHNCLFSWNIKRKYQKSFRRRINGHGDKYNWSFTPGRQVSEGNLNRGLSLRWLEVWWVTLDSFKDDGWKDGWLC